MDTIQTDVSDEALVDAIRLNMCELFRHCSKSNPAEHFENERFTRWHTQLAYPWFNGVISYAPPREDDEAFIHETIQYFHDRKVGLFTWWMEPPLKPSEWEATLSNYGFGFSTGTPGMAVDLRALNDSPQRLEGFEIVRAEDRQSTREWAKIFVEGYGLPAELKDPWFEVWLKMGFDFPIRNYLGYLHGEPVATSSVFFGGGVAGIYCVATLPAARGRGIGAAVTVKPLQDAMAMGYRIGILQSSKMGFSVYKRLGFKHLCQIENFYLRISA